MYMCKRFKRCPKASLLIPGNVESNKNRWANTLSTLIVEEG